MAETKAAAAFADVPGDAWCAPYVEICAKEGLLNGVGDGRFLPEGVVNNDEALVMAARALWQSDGGQGALPTGVTPEELVELLGEDQRQLAWPALDDATRLSELWPWDGFCYLARRGAELGFQLPDFCFNTYPATRQDFFALLALAGRDLPVLNHISMVPGCRDEAILHLYRAGILSGTDGHGSFQSQRHLTRSEAAAALARLAKPELRLRFTPEPSPWTGYTLTELATATERPIETYPVALMDKILTLDGERVDYPPGRLVGGTSISQAGDYCFLQPSTEDFDEAGQHQWHFYAALIDADGRLPIPPWTYDYLQPLSGGGFLAMRLAEVDYDHHWYLLNPQGQIEKELPNIQGTPDNGWYEYNEGLCPRRSEESGLWGYVDSDGQWVIPPQWDGAGSFHHGQAIVHSKDQCGVIDRSGTLVIPMADGELYPGYLSESSDAPMRYRWDNKAYYYASNIWIDGAGNVVPSPMTDPETWAWGHLYYQNGWFCDGETYYDLEGRQCSETFDWCGPLTADGRGFVGLSGRVYRIEFAQ